MKDRLNGSARRHVRHALQSIATDPRRGAGALRCHRQGHSCGLCPAAATTDRRGWKVEIGRSLAYKGTRRWDAVVLVSKEKAYNECVMSGM